MFNRLGKVDGYSYYINNDSDDDYICGSDSSDDENDKLNDVNAFLEGTPDEKRRALQRFMGDEISSSEDEFEKTMKQELNQAMEKHEKSWMPVIDDQSHATGSKAKAHSSKRPETYDDVYFDSDEDTEDQENKAKKQRLTDDELFYDPFSDDRDQKWVNQQQRRGSLTKDSKQSASSQEGDVCNNQVVLTCPACLTTLCMDCQRHEFYKGQYRAMFVLNCKIQNDEILRYKEPKKKTFKRHKKKEPVQQATMAEAGYAPADNATTATSAEDAYHPVKCVTCSTEVAVFDKEEVYHFFNVIAGPA